MFKNKEYILAIAREGGFSKAAEKLYISQPSLSASVKRIEEKVSLPIFDRTTSPITLTEVGKKYVHHALEMERMEREFESYINDHVNLLSGEIKIGGSSLFSSFMLPAMISEFHQKYPHVDIKIFENNTKNLIRELSEGNLDIIIDNAIIKNENITSILYTSETILLAVPTTFKANQKLKRFAFSADDVKENKHLSADCAIALEAFSEEPFILLNSENDTGKRADLLFKKHKMTPNIPFRLDQQMTAYHISCSGMGISWVSDTLIKKIASNKAICYYKLTDPEITRNIYFYQKSNPYHSIACQKFLEYNTKQ
ncbi:MAG: LysR family transcriptional regulator [Clostridia bacterium]|nr:LysR family transcriptional regulator [Clostridia bacterium]